MATWRVGRKLGRTLYKDDQCVGMVDTSGVASEIVETMNATDEEDARKRGVREAVALVREAAALYASHEGTPSACASDYPSRIALEACASNIELTLLGGKHG